MSCHYNDLLAGHFKIKKIQELVAQKYRWLTFCYDVEAHMKGCNMCLTSRAVCHKFYRNLQSLLVLAYWWKDFFIDFVTDLPIVTNWKSQNYDLIMVIFDLLKKKIYYEPVKVIIDLPDFIKIIINLVVIHYGLFDSIVSNWRLVFTLKFWSSFYYFLRIKQRLLTVLYQQVDGYIKRQNSIMEVYLQVFVNCKQNNWARFLPIAEFAYNNAKNINTGQS